MPLTCGAVVLAVVAVGLRPDSHDVAVAKSSLADCYRTALLDDANRCGDLAAAMRKVDASKTCEDQMRRLGQSETETQTFLGDLHAAYSVKPELLGCGSP